MSRKSAALIFQFQGEERLVFGEQAKEDPVALPDRQILHFFDRHPFQGAFVVFSTGKTDKRFIRYGSCEKKHVFRSPFIRHEGDNSTKTQGIRCEAESGLFPDLAYGTFLRAFTRFKLAADPDPFVFVFIRFFFDPVEHKVFSAVFQIAERGVFHGFHLSGERILPYQG